MRHYQRKGWCTLNFDYRAHGRSEVAPGAYSAELLGEDAAAMISSAYGGQPAHMFGWSLGGALGYYLALEHPSLVSSVSMSGMTSCFGRQIRADGGCSQSVLGSVIFWAGDAPWLHKLLGTEALGWFASVRFLFAHSGSEEVMRFFRFQSTSALTRTPATWGNFDSGYYHESIRKIDKPVRCRLAAVCCDCSHITVPCVLRPVPDAHPSVYTIAGAAHGGWERDIDRHEHADNVRGPAPAAARRANAGSF